MNWYNKHTIFSSLRVTSQDDSAVASAAHAHGYNVGPVYHGSSDPDIRVFDINRAGSVKVSDWGKGMYFTPSRGTADIYREDAVEKTDSRGDELWAEYEEAAKELGTTPMMSGLDLGRDSEEYAYLDQFFKRWSKYINELRDHSDKGHIYSVYLSIHNPYYYVPQSITDPYLDWIARGRGHDSILIVYEGESDPMGAQEIVVFSPSQIKSADLETYDDNGDVIPLSQRFDSSSDDIRY
jgi:hypothetical protein